MAWNPSPEVAVVRDAATRLSQITGQKVEQAVIVFITDEAMGYASYGVDKFRCAAAKRLADHLYDETQRYILAEHGNEVPLKEPAKETSLYNENMPIARALRIMADEATLSEDEGILRLAADRMDFLEVRHAKNLKVKG